MSLTPSNSRMMSPAWGGIKLTPSPSPFTKTTPLRSPIKPQRPEVSLALRRVIGTTTNSANAFDSLASAQSFAFCAGAAAVLATIDDQHRISQRFYRARPAANPINPSASVYGGPSTPTQNESRNRTAASLRDAGIGASPFASSAQDWYDSPGSKGWSARDRIKAATCVSFSPDGKFLAVGETGYKPRVLIFSTATDAPSDTPLTSIADHTFGVRCVAFSPDSQYLASLGSSNDGFLYIWSINARTGAAILHSSNKCTSNINRITWMGNSLITVGTRHVKVWRVEDPQSTPRQPKSRQSDTISFTNAVHKTLPGRNCLLESLLEANFTSVVAATPTKALVASERGDICLIDDSDGTQRFAKIAEAGFSVTSMAIDGKGRLHLASSQGGLRTLKISETIHALTPPPSPPSRIETAPANLASPSQNIEAVASLRDYIVTIDSQHAIRLSHICAPNDEGAIGEVVQELPAHGAPVLGVSSLEAPNSFDACFYTWSTGGTVLFWSRDGTCKETVRVPLEQFDGANADTNELRIVSASSDASLLVTGDKYGVVRMINRQSQSRCFEFKAHANEVTSIAIHRTQQPTYIATSARDRMIQIFNLKNGSWDLMQTLDEHVGAVTGILFSRNGERLVSMSSDRTLVVRELVSRPGDGQIICAFLIARTVILKTTPTSMTWDADQEDTLLLSTIDRQVHKYDLRSGQSLKSFRVSDADGSDAVVLSSLVHIPRNWASPLIAGVSSTDKSIRLYDESGMLLARDWGHTEGVTDIALVDMEGKAEANSCEKSLVTVAVDGTIFVWGLSLQSPNRQELAMSMDFLGPTTPTNQDLLASRPPLRRVFSQSELARFQRSPDEDQSTPTGGRSPKLRKKLSKFALASTPKLDPSPLPSVSRDRGMGANGQGSLRRSNRHRSPSPPSPRNPQVAKRRSSVDVRLRSKTPASEFGSLGASTESLCRTLRAYRKRITNSTDSLSSETVRDVERELALTARAVGEKARSNDPVNEAVMVKLLDQYSERLVNILDERIAASVALRIRENSDSGTLLEQSDGLASTTTSPMEGGNKEPLQGGGKEVESSAMLAAVGAVTSD